MPSGYTNYAPFQRNPGYEEELGRLFRRASQGRISVEELRQKSTSLEEKVDTEKNLLLRDAFCFVDELHDGINNRSLDQYAKWLMGEESRDYFYRPSEGVQVKVTYEKR